MCLNPSILVKNAQRLDGGEKVGVTITFLKLILSWARYPLRGADLGPNTTGLKLIAFQANSRTLQVLVQGITGSAILVIQKDLVLNVNRKTTL